MQHTKQTHKQLTRVHVIASKADCAITVKIKASTGLESLPCRFAGVATVMSARLKAKSQDRSTAAERDLSNTCAWEGLRILFVSSLDYPH